MWCVVGGFLGALAGKVAGKIMNDSGTEMATVIIFGAFPRSCPRAYKAAPRPAKCGELEAKIKKGSQPVGCVVGGFLGPVAEEVVGDHQVHVHLTPHV